MKLKKKLLIKKWLSLILVFLLILTSINITSYAFTSSGTLDGGAGGTIPSSTGKGGRNILRSYGAMIGIHRNPNTGAAYSDIINAHNTGMTNGKVWDECLFSCVEQNLYKYPQHFLSQGCVENNAVILINKNTNPVTKPLHYVTDTGAISEKPFCNYYVVSRKDKGDLTWSPIVIRDRIESDPKLLHAFQTYSLDVDVVKSLVASSQMDANIAAFVSLWGKASNVSKTINSMYKEGPEYYYDNLLKYLDLLCIINEMCNGAYWDEIEDFLRTLNQDGSSDFISVYAASLVWVQPTNVTSVYTLFTLPNYYGACTGLGYSPFLKFTGQNSEISVDAHSPGGAGSYELTGVSWESALRNQYNGVNNGRAARFTDLWDNNRDLVWWSKKLVPIVRSFNNYGAAQLLYPKDTYDFGTGNLVC